jgi:hypothetical protein
MNDFEFSHFFICRYVPYDKQDLAVIASEATQSTVTLPATKTPAERGLFLASLD